MRLPQERGRKAVIEMHRAQRSFGDGLIAEEVDDIREDWMKVIAQPYLGIDGSRRIEVRL